MGIDNQFYIDKLQKRIEKLEAALKDIQARAVGVNPPRHTWYYDRAEDALNTNGVVAANTHIEKLEAALREIKDQYLSPDQSNAIAKAALK